MPPRTFRLRATAARAASAALLFLGAAGCASDDPIDLVGACPRTTVAFARPPLDPVAVRLRLDARPLVEHGRESYLGESHVAEQQFKTPVAESLLAVFVRDLKDSRLFKTATLRPGPRAYRVDVDVLHAYASYGTGLTSIVPLLPTSSLRSEVALRVVFSDEDGRVYLDERFEARRDSATAPIAGARGSSADLFGAVLRDVVDRVLVALDASYDAFWSRYPAESRPRR